MTKKESLYSLINISNIGKQIMAVSFTGGTTVTPGITINYPPPPNQNAVFAFGSNSYKNIVSSLGILEATSTVTPGASFRNQPGGSTYGSGRAIFAYGDTSPAVISTYNYVTSAGVIGADNSGVGTARQYASGVGYGTTGQGMFAYGLTPAGSQNMTNFVSNTGVIASDTPNVGTTASWSRGACTFGSTGQAIFGFGGTPAYTSITNIVSNTGVIASDTVGVPGVTARRGLQAASYGGDKGIFGFGQTTTTPAATNTNITNLISNLGIVAANIVNASATARGPVGAATYGNDKAIFGFGFGPTGPSQINTTNLVSNTGVVAANVTPVSGTQSSVGCVSFN